VPHLRVVVTTPEPLRTGKPVSRRRIARERMMRRRRRSALALASVVTLVILAWPGHAFGGVTGSGALVDRADSSVLASGMVYVVRPGDTVDSIAKAVNPSNVAVARAAIVHELGSSVVVAGEHVLIP
jgi:hypothetical protein